MARFGLGLLVIILFLRLGFFNLLFERCLFPFGRLPFFLGLGLFFLWLPLVLWRHLVQNKFVKRTLLLLPPFFGIMLVVGVIDELRIYGELIPIVLSAFLLILKELFRAAEADPAGPE